MTKPRFVFSFGGQSYTFKRNPQEYSRKDAPRADFVGTQGGYFIEHHGPGLGTLTISGSIGRESMTGGKYQHTNDKQAAYAQEISELGKVYKAWVDYYKKNHGGKSPDCGLSDPFRGDKVVGIATLEVRRTVAKALLYNYTLTIQYSDNKEGDSKDKNTISMLDSSDMPPAGGGFPSGFGGSSARLA